MRRGRARLCVYGGMQSAGLHCRKGETLNLPWVWGCTPPGSPTLIIASSKAMWTMEVARILDPGISVQATCTSATGTCGCTGGVAPLSASQHAARRCQAAAAYRNKAARELPATPTPPPAPTRSRCAAGRSAPQSLKPKAWTPPAPPTPAAAAPGRSAPRRSTPAAGAGWGPAAGRRRGRRAAAGSGGRGRGGGTHVSHPTTRRPTPGAGEMKWTHPIPTTARANK